ncbi:MAG: methyltransferase domain-containing protein [bacterium]|nr:methyltransferase domain-containing protein [bacterium]
MSSPHARLYDLAIAPLERSLLRHSRAWIGQRARGRVLAVGIGTGADLPYLTRASHVTGLDLSLPLLDGAASRARDLTIPVVLVHGNAESLPFEDSSFDSTIATYTLCGIGDPEAALREMIRVTRPGGDMLLADHVASSTGWVRAGQRVLEGVTGRHGEHWLRRPRLILETLDVEILDSVRTTFGALERVHARRRA